MYALRYALRAIPAMPVLMTAPCAVAAERTQNCTQLSAALAAWLRFDRGVVRNMAVLV